jgi:uncharacterized membrane protein
MGEDRLETVSRDERLQVGFSYLFGWIPALVFWIQSKGKSEYVRFHTMQAILYNIVLACISTLVMGLMVVSFVFSVIFFTTSADLSSLHIGVPNSIQSLPMLIFFIGCIFIPLIFYFAILLIQGINIIATIQGFSGKDWRYPLLAKWAEKINQRDMETSLRNES